MLGTQQITLHLPEACDLQVFLVFSKHPGLITLVTHRKCGELLKETITSAVSYKLGF